MTTTIQSIEDASREALENAALTFAQAGKEIRELKARLQELERTQMEAEAICRKAWSTVLTTAKAPPPAPKSPEPVAVSPVVEAPPAPAVPPAPMRPREIEGRKLSDRQARILDLLSNGAMKCSEIQQGLQESSYQNVFSTLGLMRNRGLIKQLEDKSWQVEDQPEVSSIPTYNPSEPRVTEWDRITLMLASEALSCADITQKLHGTSDKISDKRRYASTNYVLKQMEGSRMIKRDEAKRWSLDEEGRKELARLTA